MYSFVSVVYRKVGSRARNQETYNCQNGNSKAKSTNRQLLQDNEIVPKYTCHECLYTSTRKGDLKRHLRIHNGFGFICRCCQKCFNRKSYLDNHYIRLHPEKSDLWKDMITCKINDCSKCSYKAVRLSHLKRHLLTHESGPHRRKYLCGVCDQKFTQKSHFTRHLRLHVGQLPFVCTECKKRFNEKRNLDGHIVAVHSNVDRLMNTVTSKKYNCSRCSFITIWFTNFKKHIKNCKNCSRIAINT